LFSIDLSSLVLSILILVFPVDSVSILLSNDEPVDDIDTVRKRGSINNNHLAKLYEILYKVDKINFEYLVSLLFVEYKNY
jgi:hypothetical protein